MFWDQLFRTINRCCGGITSMVVVNATLMLIIDHQNVYIQTDRYWNESSGRINDFLSPPKRCDRCTYGWNSPDHRQLINLNTSDIRRRVEHDTDLYVWTMTRLIYRDIFRWKRIRGGFFFVYEPLGLRKYHRYKFERELFLAVVSTVAKGNIRDKFILSGRIKWCTKSKWWNFTCTYKFAAFRRRIEFNGGGFSVSFWGIFWDRIL